MQSGVVPLHRLPLTPDVVTPTEEPPASFTSLPTTACTTAYAFVCILLIAILLIFKQIDPSQRVRSNWTVRWSSMWAPPSSRNVSRSDRRRWPGYAWAGAERAGDAP